MFRRFKLYFYFLCYLQHNLQIWLIKEENMIDLFTKFGFLRGNRQFVYSKTLGLNKKPKKKPPALLIEEKKVMRNYYFFLDGLYVQQFKIQLKL